jgi:hypothetical protein
MVVELPVVVADRRAIADEHAVVPDADTVIVRDVARRS